MKKSTLKSTEKLTEDLAVLTKKIKRYSLYILLISTASALYFYFGLREGTLKSDAITCGIISAGIAIYLTIINIVNAKKHLALEKIIEKNK